MNNNELTKKVSNALKWSSLAEILAKIIVPISNIILARLLSPEEFGIVATVTMVISFADMFSEAGFSQFLVQYEFDTEKKLFISSSVAFTANLLLSLALWALIAIFNAPLASIVGNPGLGNVLIIAGISLPITSFSSIQLAIYRRTFNYKVLFYARIASALSNFLITIPLALLGFGFWSIIIGTLAGNIISAVILTVSSKWKPKLYFNWVEFKRMFSFSFWSLLESLGTWLTSYVGTFIVGNILSTYYLGLYKTTVTTVNGIFALITSATTSVLFSMLSRLQFDREKYDDAYINFVKDVSIVIIPLGFGIYIFRDLVTSILLGSQWMKTVPFVGIYGLISCFTLIYGQYAGEYYRGLGKPKASVLTAILYLFALIPTLYLTASHGFLSLAYGRSFVKIYQILMFWLVLWFGFRFNPFRLLKATYKSILSAVVMATCGKLLLLYNSSIYFELISVLVCIVVYFLTYILIFKGKDDIKLLYELVKRRK